MRPPFSDSHPLQALHQRAHGWRTRPRPWLDNPLSPLYAYLALVGILTAAAGVSPKALEYTAPAWINYGWTGTLALAGVLSLAGCVTERNRVEAAGLALLLVALGLYGIATAQTDGVDALTNAIAIGSLAACAWLRMRVLRKSRKAVKRAQHQLAGGGLGE